MSDHEVPEGRWQSQGFGKFGKDVWCAEQYLTPKLIPISHENEKSALARDE